MNFRSSLPHHVFIGYVICRWPPLLLLDWLYNLPQELFFSKSPWLEPAYYSCHVLPSIFKYFKAEITVAAMHQSFFLLFDLRFAYFQSLWRRRISVLSRGLSLSFLEIRRLMLSSFSFFLIFPVLSSILLANPGPSLNGLGWLKVVGNVGPSFVWMWRCYS